MKEVLQFMYEDREIKPRLREGETERNNAVLEHQWL
jgi:hypothetical protein